MKEAKKKKTLAEGCVGLENKTCFELIFHLLVRNTAMEKGELLPSAYRNHKNHPSMEITEPELNK